MATLEIHDERNQVRRVRIGREQPTMFGSDKMCDVQIKSPGVQPFHGRLRWKGDRFKVDTAPDVSWIEVNGQLVRSKSLALGDEIKIGACRIFLLSTEDGPDQGEKTVVQAPPAVGAKAGAGPGVPLVPTRPHSGKPARKGEEPAIEFLKLDMAPPSLEGLAPPGERKPEGPLKRMKYRKLGALDESAGEQSAAPADGRPEPKRARIKRPDLRSYLPWADRAPGDDRVLNSPIVLGLAATFAILAIASVALWFAIARANARKLYASAVENLERGEFRESIRDFDRFLTANPDDTRSPKAKVLRALGRVRQHTGAAGASWGNALKEARAMVEEVGDLEPYRDSSTDLVDEVRKAAEGLAERARDLADPPSLAEAESAVSLHARIAGSAAASLLERSKVPEKLASARASIRKAGDRDKALAAMDAAIGANKPGDAYAARDGLVLAYPDLANHKQVVARLIRANELVLKAVTLDPSARPAETVAHPDPLGPPTSLVLRLDPGKAPGPGPRNPVAYALADGLAFGLDAATGAPRWQLPVGLASPFPPVPIAGDPPSALVVDARSDELARIDGRTGGLLWRQGLGGPVLGPPMVLGNQVLQPTPDGRLLQIDLISGALRGTLRLGRRLAHAPVADDSAQHLYLLGDEDCLFVLTPDPLACVAVEYLGQESGSVPCSPARVGRYLVVPENREIDRGRWRVFVLDESGTAIRPAQELPVGGWTRTTPASSGPVIWSSSDRGELIAYAIGQYDAKAPFTPVARTAAGAEGEGPAFPRARTDRDFWISSSRTGRYELDLERGKLTPAWTLNEAGPALGPIQSFDRVAVLTHQNADGPGTALWGVEPASGRVAWRTVLGSNWAVPPGESRSGDALTTLAVDGRAVTIGRDALRLGGFVEQGLPKPGGFRVPPEPARRLEFDGATVIVTGPGASIVQVRAGDGEFLPVELPAPLAAWPVAMGPDLFVPGADGRAYLIDPRTGLAAADPYVPAFDRSRPTRWRTPVAIGPGAVAMADGDSTIRRIEVSRSPRARLVASAEAKLDRPMVADPASAGEAVLIATGDGRIRSLAARDLSAQGSWPMEAPRVMGPVAVADHAFAADSAGNVVAFGPDGRRLWSSKLLDGPPIGPPALRDGSAWFLGRDGSAERLSLADGTPRGRVALGVLPSAGPLVAGPDLVIPTGPGTLRVLLDPAQAAEGVR